MSLGQQIEDLALFFGVARHVDDLSEHKRLFHRSPPCAASVCRSAAHPFRPFCLFFPFTTEESHNASHDAWSREWIPMDSSGMGLPGK